MIDKVFVDSNIFIYAVTDDPLKSEVARQSLLSDSEFHLSTQVLNEFISVCQRKKIITNDEIQQSIEGYLKDFQLHLLTDATIRLAMQLQTRYNLSYWDALIIASALEAECSILYSEDLQHDLVIDNQVTIRTPFL